MRSRRPAARRADPSNSDTVSTWARSRRAAMRRARDRPPATPIYRRLRRVVEASCSRRFEPRNDEVVLLADAATTELVAADRELVHELVAPALVGAIALSR